MPHFKCFLDDDHTAPLEVEYEMMVDDTEWPHQEWAEINGVSLWGTSLKMDLIPHEIMADIKETALRLNNTVVYV